MRWDPDACPLIRRKENQELDLVVEGFAIAVEDPEDSATAAVSFATGLVADPAVAATDFAPVEESNPAAAAEGSAVVATDLVVAVAAATVAGVGPAEAVATDLAVVEVAATGPVVAVAAALQAAEAELVAVVVRPAGQHLVDSSDCPLADQIRLILCTLLPFFQPRAF